MDKIPSSIHTPPTIPAIPSQIKQYVPSSIQNQINQLTGKPLRRAEDILPKVLVAGKPNDCVPRIIICDGMQKKSKRSHSGNGLMHFRIPNLPVPGLQGVPAMPALPGSSRSGTAPASYPAEPSCPPQLTCCPPSPPKCPPPIKSSSRRKPSECCPPQPPNPPSNMDDCSPCSKLMTRMQNLKEEMYVMARQNEKMQQQLSGGHYVQRCRTNQSAPCARPVTYPKDVESRFSDYSKHNSLLEKQVEAMEQSVRRLNQQFIEAEKKQKEMEQARIHAQKMTQTLMCQQMERQPKLRCVGSCKGKCANQTEKCSCSRPDYKCA